MTADEPRLRPLRTRIAAAARAAGKPQWIIEKDWALSYVLLGLASVPELRKELVFKGGTCLRKMYFHGYRFSEDLDFSARSQQPCAQLLDQLRDATSVTLERMAEFGPFQMNIRSKPERDVHPRGQCAFDLHVQFPWMPSPQLKLKIEITANEPILHAIAERMLIHEFDEEKFAPSLSCYSLEEVAAEKLRALLQSRKHLVEKGWVNNRPRDVYDLAYLREQSEYKIDWVEVASLLEPKAAAYSIGFGGPDDFLDEEVWRGIERDWKAKLADFIPDNRSFDDCASPVRAMIQELVADAGAHHD